MPIKAMFRNPQLTYAEAKRRVLAMRLMMEMEGRAVGVVHPGSLAGHRVSPGDVFHLSFDPLDEDGNGVWIVYGCLEGVGPITPTFEEFSRRFVLSCGSGDSPDGDEYGVSDNDD